METVEAVFPTDKLGDLGSSLDTEIIDVQPLSSDEYEEIGYDEDEMPNLARVTYTCERLQHDSFHTRSSTWTVNGRERRLYIYADSIPVEVLETALEYRRARGHEGDTVRVFEAEDHGWVIEVDGETEETLEIDHPKP